MQIMIETPDEVTSTQAQQAADEAYRELCVRQRCFPNWVKDGRLTRSDAQDRLERMQLAQKLLAVLAECMNKHEGTLDT